MKQYISERASSIKYSGIRRMVALAAEMTDVISFALGEPDSETPKNITEAAIKAIKDGYTHYTSTAGLLEFREAVAEKFDRENGIKYDPQTEIIATVGACEACYAAIMSTINPGDGVMITDPAFVFYAPTITLAGGKPVPVPLKEESNFRPDFEEVERLIDPTTKMIWINSPQNPTGSILLEKDFREISRIARDYDLLVLTDEVYEKFVYGCFKHHSIGALPGMKERTITVNALSKTYAMTGWRIGYIAADKELTSKIHLVHMHICTHPNAIAQKAAVEALKGPQNSVDRMVKEFAERRDFMIRRLNEIDGISCWKSRGSFYAFPKVSELGISSYELAEYILKDGKVNTVPGAAFGKQGEGYLRLSFASPMGAIEEGMARLEKSVQRIRKQPVHAVSNAKE